MAIQCHLICVGSELLRGKINLHASTLSQRLLSLGIQLAHEETVPDNLPELVEAIRLGLERFQIVIVTGGLGPTFDDVTREAAAAATHRRLVRSEKMLRELHVKFRRARYKAMPPMNARQADILEGAEFIPNGFGTAPGQWLGLPATQGVKGKRVLILLPGPPRELKPMLEAAVLPGLRKMFDSRPRAEAHLHFVGIPESLADQKIRPIIRRFEQSKNYHVEFTILAHLGLVDFDVFVEAASERQAKHLVASIATAVKQRLKSFCYGIDGDHPLEKVVGQRLRAAQSTIATAESCTGGLLAAQLTEVSGSSDYFKGGVVVYANEEKQVQLGVPEKLLGQYGAVSSEVARLMAQNVQQRWGTTYGISTTGIAGPGGGTGKKPVGLVYIALATHKRTKVIQCQFPGSRDVVRARAVTAALDLLRQELLVKSKDFR